MTTQTNNIKAAVAAFVATVKSELETADTDSITSAFDVVVPNIIDTDILGDSANWNTPDIDDRAKAKVLEFFLGALCYSIENGLMVGRKQADQAAGQTARAVARDETSRTQQSQEHVQSRLDWECQMQCQQVYREALRPIALAVFKEAFDKDYTFQKATVAATRGASALAGLPGHG
jgi:hypothetical protein